MFEIPPVVHLVGNWICINIYKYAVQRWISSPSPNKPGGVQPLDYVNKSTIISRWDPRIFDSWNPIETCRNPKKFWGKSQEKSQYNGPGLNGADI